MICPKCGNTLPDNAAFCDRCGLQFAQGAQQMNAPQHAYGAAAPKKSGVKWIIIGAAAAAVVAIVLVLVFVLGGDSADTSTAEGMLAQYFKKIEQGDAKALDKILYPQEIIDKMNGDLKVTYLYSSKVEHAREGYEKLGIKNSDKIDLLTRCVCVPCVQTLAKWSDYAMFSQDEMTEFLNNYTDGKVSIDYEIVKQGGKNDVKYVETGLGNKKIIDIICREGLDEDDIEDIACFELKVNVSWNGEKYGYVESDMKKLENLSEMFTSERVEKNCKDYNLNMILYKYKGKWYVANRSMQKAEQNPFNWDEK